MTRYAKEKRRRQEIPGWGGERVGQRWGRKVQDPEKAKRLASLQSWVIQINASLQE